MVIEIGAGTGALTEELAQRARRLIAIERDRDLVPILRERFPSIEVVECDAQTAPLEAWLQKEAPPRVLAGNLPYQITGRLMRRVVDVSHAIERAVFMVQLEVCDRLLATPATKDYGALTVFMRAAMRAERVATVSRGAFCPRPEVTSAVVRLEPRPDRIPETHTFRTLVKRAFEARRKTLRNAWSGVAPREKLEQAAKRAGVSLDARGETLDVDAFAAVSSALTG